MSKAGKPGGNAGAKWPLLLGSAKDEKKGNGEGRPSRGCVATAEVGGGGGNAGVGAGALLALKGWNGDSVLVGNPFLEVIHLGLRNQILKRKSYSLLLYFAAKLLMKSL